MKRFLMDLSVNGCSHSANLSLVESYVSWLKRRHVAAVLRREHGRAKPFCNRVTNLKGREGWSAFLGSNHFNNLQSLIVAAFLITTGSESAFIFSINGRDEFSYSRHFAVVV